MLRQFVFRLVVTQGYAQHIGYRKVFDADAIAYFAWLEGVAWRVFVDAGGQNCGASRGGAFAIHCAIRAGCVHK